MADCEGAEDLPDLGKPENILLIKMSSLGDVVHGVPTLAAVRVRFPAAKITWLVDERFRDVIAAHPALKSIIAAPAPKWLTTWPAARTLRAAGQYQVIPELRSRRFDLVLDLQGLFRTGFLAAATGARQRIGLAEAREGAPLFYTQTISAPWQWHAVRRCLRLAELLGARAEHASPRIYVEARGLEAAQRLRSEHGLAAAEPYVVVSPRSSRVEKNWPPERFAELIAHLWRARGLRTLLLGGGTDSPVCRQIAADSHSPAIVVTRVRLSVAMAIISEAALVVSNDSGPLHLAAALARPLVGIYGPTDPARVGPWENERWVVQETANCPRCQAERSHPSRRLTLTALPPHTCLNELPVGSVLARVELAIDEAHAVRQSA
jgi:lipopolysaccharide heptosyltransferase I